ncbi:MAG: hypothetical protein GKS00_20565 [Alphaproteobacteria bacterium]|nr:hypothetical protein [Alphaproteobacteria bacterium]
MKWLVITFTGLAIVTGLVSGVFNGPVVLAAEKQANVTIERTIKKRKLVEANVIRVTEGQMVELRWNTDETADLHLHGYDIEVKAKPGAPATMRFKAHATGRFPVTVHGFGNHHGGGHAEKTLLYLEVHPN